MIQYENKRVLLIGKHLLRHWAFDFIAFYFQPLTNDLNNIIPFSTVTKTIFLRQISTPNEWMGWSIKKKSYNNEFFACFTGNTISALIGYRKRVRLFFNCVVAYPMWMGARGYSCSCHFE